jgi:hypothetical protein
MSTMSMQGVEVVQDAFEYTNIVGNVLPPYSS